MVESHSNSMVSLLMSEGSGLWTFCCSRCAVFLILGSLGCNGRPSNPGYEVVSHPPAEVNADVFEEVKVTLNDVDPFAAIPMLTRGENVAVRASVVRHDKSIPSMINIHVRLLPEGSPEERWVSFDFADEFNNTINILSGQSEFTSVVRAAPGRFDVRCYALYIVATEEKPAFYLIGKGKAEVTEGRKEPTGP